jgi:hypothetical protein
MRLALFWLLGAWACDALLLGTSPHIRPPRIFMADTEGAASSAIGEPETADAMMPAEEEDPLGDGDFIRWYRMEKAKEAYLKENPRDVVGEAVEKLKSPLQSLVILAGGFYILPLIKSIKQGLADGDLVGQVGFALNNPTKVLDLGAPVDIGASISEAISSTSN